MTVGGGSGSLAAASMQQRALSRMLGLGYGLQESELALLRSGGDVNEAIQELHGQTQRTFDCPTRVSGLCCHGLYAVSLCM